MYTNTAILEEVLYGPGDLLLLALISGGDYSNGIPNCGAAIVTALVRCGFGNRLHNYLYTLEGIELDDALSELSKDITEELRTNSRGFLSSRRPALAQHMTSNCFDPAILSLYTHPITSWSRNHRAPNHSLWVTQEPDLLEVVRMCMIHLGWNTVDKLTKNLHNVLLEGLFVRALCSVSDVALSHNSRD